MRAQIVKRYLVEWKIKHSCTPDCYWHNMSKEFTTKKDAEQFISKLKHTYEPPEDYYDKLSVKEPKEIDRLDESYDYNNNVKLLEVLERIISHCGNRTMGSLFEREWLIELLTD